MKKFLIGLVGFSLFFSHAITPTAFAFSVRVHIYYANLIRDELIRTQGQTEGPSIQLLGPEIPGGKNPPRIQIDRADAAAIIEHGEYWRGGAIGPDNTVFSGLTDPSHAPDFFPFAQCEALYQQALKTENGEERAYALGCFLHGITDNVAHHVVNYYSQQSFTLNPQHRGTLEDGGFVREPNEGLETSFLNVVNHITTESKLEKAFSESFTAGAGKDEFAPERVQHTIARDLYKRSYLDPNDPNYLMKEYAGPLIRRKNDALKVGQLADQDPNKVMSTTIEELRESGRVIDEDFEAGWYEGFNTIIGAYKNFIATGGVVLDSEGKVTAGESLAPMDYILLFPEILNDIGRVLDRLAEHGAFLVQECKDVSWTDVSGKTRCAGTKYLYKRGDDGEPSRFEKAVATKKEELDGIIDGHLRSLENLSNMLVKKGDFSQISTQDLDIVFTPLIHALENVTDFPSEFLPDWLGGAFRFFKPLQGLLQKITEIMQKAIHEVVVQAFREQIEAIMTELQSIQKEAMDAALNAINQDIVMYRERMIREIHNQLSEEQAAITLALLGLEEDRDALEMLRSIPTSVAHMNAYNSIAGVLANRGVVIQDGFYGGPVSFDASYQLEYNQLALCPKYREVFYPCGTSSAEMLQPNDYRSCVSTGLQMKKETLIEGDPSTPKDDLLIVEVLHNPPIGNPWIECHSGDPLRFAEKPDFNSCKRVRSVDELLENHQVGSVSLSFPPFLVPQGKRPKCQGIEIPMI